MKITIIMKQHDLKFLAHIAEHPEIKDTGLNEKKLINRLMKKLKEKLKKQFPEKVEITLQKFVRKNVGARVSLPQSEK